MAEIKEPIEKYGLSQKDKKKSLFSKIGVVGCGQEGRAIVSLTALSGMEVVFIEVSEEKIQEALTVIENGFDTKSRIGGLLKEKRKQTWDVSKGRWTMQILKIVTL